MSAPTYWIDATPEVECRDGVLVVTLTSGGEPFSFAMSMNTCLRLGARVARGVADLDAQRAEVVSFVAEKRARRQRK